MSVLEVQLAQLRDRYGNVEVKLLGSGTTLVTVHEVPLPPGWNKAKTSVRFLVPPTYPYSALDCFWADPDLRLAGELVPQASNANNPIPEDGGGGLWFSWHLTGGWNANRDTLSSWMNTINDRLRRAL